ncbi:sulfatase [Thalassoroseus pseudoceratinae]|uniref:sulfatase n=1 Tax=Thalassoroseus pseudoceratinae TaxID=2713176 RepID=UPI00141E850D|nr:sulfatase [Thalassoroseus pseudoceratinae]
MRITLLIACGIAGFCSASLSAADRPNVLLIAIDDLNDWTGCLGGHPQADTPHIDALAKQGTLFTNAHCQAPICNPSRTSVMLGLRPSTTGIYQNRPWFRTTKRNRDRITLPQYFRQHGYKTLTTGKIYHGSRVDEASFETVGPRPGQRLKIDDRLVQIRGTGSGLWDYGPQQYAEENFSDFSDASWAITQLQRDHKRPFFLAVGFYRPHVPWYAPQRFFDTRPLADVKLPLVKDDDRDDLPQAAIALTNNPTPPSHQWFVENMQWRAAVQAYLASTSFTDAQVGRLLDVFNASPYAKNTIIVLWSDHGFHLGEKQRWAKQSLWERSTRVPFIICRPGQSGGQRCSQAVELLSIYPTLVKLCGLPARDDLEGVDLSPLLADPKASWKRPAISTYGRNNHAIRSEHFRYIRYADGSQELYDHRNDPQEWKNLAGDPAFAKTIAEHAKWLPQTNVANAAKK